MYTALTAKLQRFSEFSFIDQVALTELGDDIRHVAAGHDVISQGERPTHVHLLLEGWACRYKLLPDGKRQIVAFMIPGDMCDVHVTLLRRMDHSMGALSPAKLALISPELIASTMERHPQIARAISWATLVDQATLREWVINVGRRDPYERLAHLLCEMWLRMSQVGLVTADCFRLPVTQAEIGDTIALTPVTVNRVLQRLRRQNLISLRDNELNILDVKQLIFVCGFDPAYLLH